LIDQTNVGVNELGKLKEISIYPNPTTDVLNIIDKGNLFQNSTIEIKNYLGQSVFNSPFTPQIDLSGLSSGMYFLTIRNMNTSQSHKIIKQ
jgi:hypothetical protein